MLQDRLVAHRGFPRQYPENTLLGYRKAIEAGARLLETDIQLTADLEPVLYHDTLMSRISGIDNAIHLLPLEQAITISAGEPSRLGQTFAAETICPLVDLVDLLKAHPEVSLFVEIKRAAVAFAGKERVYDIVTEKLAGITGRATLISFDQPFMAHARRQGYRRLGTVLTDWEKREDAVAGVEPEFLFCDRDKIPAGADLGDFDSKLVVYEVDDPDEGIELFRRGADMLETFDIAGMLSGLSRHSL